MVGLQIFAKPRGPVASTAADDQQEKSGKSSASVPSRRQPPRNEVIVRVSSGKWAGDHKAMILQRGRPPQNRKKLTAAEELQQLQGVWDLKEVMLSKKSNKTRDKPEDSAAKVYVRGKRVEESMADGSRRFFNLVLAEKACDPMSRAKRKSPSENDEPKLHSLPPLQGPEALPVPGQKGQTAKGKGKKQSKQHCVGHWILLHHTPKLLILKDGVSAQEPYWWHPEEQAAWSRCGRAEESLTVQYVNNEHTEKLNRHANDPSGTWRTCKGVKVSVLASNRT